MTPLKEIESWCYKQIELINRLYDMKDFPEEVERCGLITPQDIACLKHVHIYQGIERIADALKLPVKIDAFSDDMYIKKVTHLGVTFFQIKLLAR